MNPSGDPPSIICEFNSVHQGPVSKQDRGTIFYQKGVVCLAGHSHFFHSA